MSRHSRFDPCILLKITEQNPFLKGKSTKPLEFFCMTKIILLISAPKLREPLKLIYCAHPSASPQLKNKTTHLTAAGFLLNKPGWPSVIFSLNKEASRELSV